MKIGGHDADHASRGFGDQPQLRFSRRHEPGRGAAFGRARLESKEFHAGKLNTIGTRHSSMRLQLVLASGTRNQTLDYVDHCRLGLSLDLCLCLILNRMSDINRVEVRAAESARLSARGSHEHIGSDRHCRHAEAFKRGRVVQTARGAGPSIGERFDHRIATRGD